MAEDEGELALDAVFTDPARPPSPPSTTAVYVREQGNADRPTDWTQITITLVGAHPLWGHYLWNAARAFATYLDESIHIYRNRCVLELGAGGGLPGIVTAINGAKKVVLTEYPDAELLTNLRHNVEEILPPTLHNRVEVEGYTWGRQVQPLLNHLSDNETHGRMGYDLIILSDLIFNHTQHEALLSTCEQVLASPASSDDGNAGVPCVLVFYSHHIPRLAHRDMNFFKLAKEKGWKCEEILKRKYPPMFADDPGDEEMRSTVCGWRLSRTANRRM